MEPCQFTFNGLLNVGLQGSRVTPDAGFVLIRELNPVGFLAVSPYLAAEARHATDQRRQSELSGLAAFTTVRCTCA